jgi:hypothetical protein
MNYILRSIFLEIPHLELCADEKRREIRMVKVFKWYPVIDLFDTSASKVVRLLFAQRFIAIFNCRYHTSNHRLPRKSLISRMDWVSCAGDINLPHDLPPTKKSSTIKSWPTFCVNCRYHTSNHLSVCHKPTSLSPINCQSVDNCCIIINTLINLHDHRINNK